MLDGEEGMALGWKCQRAEINKKHRLALPCAEHQSFLVGMRGRNGMVGLLPAEGIGLEVNLVDAPKEPSTALLYEVKDLEVQG